MKVVKKSPNEIRADEADDGEENGDAYILFKGHVEAVVREDYEVPEESHPDTYEDVQDSFNRGMLFRLTYSHRSISPM